MKIKMLKLGSPGFPVYLSRMSKPPAQVYIAGDSIDELMRRPRVAIVGSRNVSAYGREVTIRLAKELSEQGIVIVSGLALGVDAIAHKAVIEAKGLAIAVLPSPIEKIVPATNRYLAQQILDLGGLLISEYAEGEEPYRQNFVARNRLMAGLADGVLITEAAEKSGSLHTAKFALQQDKEVMAVPGNITSKGYVGANNLIKRGAALITNYQDVLHVLGLEEHETIARKVKGRNQHEQTILNLMLEGRIEGDQLLDLSELGVTEFNQALLMLELGGKIRSLGANRWAIY